MGTLGAIGNAWDRYCRRLRPEEAGALWGLVSMAHDSRVRGCVVARAGVLAAAWSLGDGQEAEERAVEILQGLRRKGAVTVTENTYTGTLMVTVGMFSDVWERKRVRERNRHKAQKKGRRDE